MLYPIISIAALVLFFIFILIHLYACYVLSKNLAAVTSEVPYVKNSIDEGIKQITQARKEITNVSKTLKEFIALVKEKTAGD